MPGTTPHPRDVTFVDLVAQVAGTTHDGPQWSYETEDLDLTLLHWATGREVAAHVNHEVDVVLLGVAGVGEVTVDDVRYKVGPGHALLIPKGAVRSLRALDGNWSYLSVHRRRRGLWPTVRGEESP